MALGGTLEAYRYTAAIAATRSNTDTASYPVNIWASLLG